MLETSVVCFRKLILAHKVFEESSQMFFRNISAVGFREKSEIGDSAISLEKYIDPQLDAFEIKLNGGSIVFHVHQQISPATIGLVYVIGIDRHES